VLQKCTEVGVRRFVPVITERTIVRDDHAFREGRLDRWVRILTEAAEQCQRGLIPELRAPVRFDRVLTDPEGGELRLVGCPRPEGKSLAGLLARGEGLKAVALFIGPEAGFSDREMEAACAAGWAPFSLGRRILRTETAAVVASALVLHQLGQMEPQG
jgi:16S rRNA (uracil1498-N3)-methyltransferase